MVIPCWGTFRTRLTCSSRLKASDIEDWLKRLHRNSSIIIKPLLKLDAFRMTVVSATFFIFSWEYEVEYK